MNAFEPSLLATDAAERRRFIAALRETGSARAAAKATGTALSTARRLRDRDRAFADEWAAALGTSPADALAASLLDRLTVGVKRMRRYADGRVEEWTEYDNRTALAVLALLLPGRFGERVAGAEPPRTVMSRAEFMAAIRMRPPTPPLGEYDDADAGDDAGNADP